MLRYAGRRVLEAGARLLLISLLLFLVLQIPPGGPADVFGADPAASPDAIARMRALWGLDRPLAIQYGVWLRRAVTGDWGDSFSERRPVLRVVWERVPATLTLTGAALALSLGAGLGLGVAGAVIRRPAWQAALQGLAVIGMSVPTFWSGMLVLLLFSGRLGWLPSGGMATVGSGFSIGDRLWHLAGPALVLGSVYVALWTRYVQAGLAEVLGEDYVRTGRGKGVSERALVLRHALPNAAIPLLTVLGLELPRLLAGAMVTEVVFAWPGLGRLLTASLLGRDYPVAMGTLMLLAVAVVAANLLTDLAYRLVDPRVRLTEGPA
ncbi:MAG TPA: ABC transporter permease [Methylomirabilota bacterium]|nr:ABC transporter permease [Methylomirabilota bacterium]